jgi:hypothetical protein
MAKVYRPYFPESDGLLASETRFVCCWLWGSGFLLVFWRFPFAPLEVEHDDRVDNWEQ